MLILQHSNNEELIKFLLKHFTKNKNGIDDSHIFTVNSFSPGSRVLFRLIISCREFVFHLLLMSNS